MKCSLLFASIYVQAVLHKEFVGAKFDKLLGDERIDGASSACYAVNWTRLAFHREA